MPKMASLELVNNCLAQLRASNQESVALSLQLDLKEREVIAVSASRASWKYQAETEKGLRLDAEAYIADVKDSGFYLGIGGATGYFKLLNGQTGPGAGIALSAGLALPMKHLGSVLIFAGMMVLLVRLEYDFVVLIGLTLILFGGLWSECWLEVLK